MCIHTLFTYNIGSIELFIHTWPRCTFECIYKLLQRLTALTAIMANGYSDIDGQKYKPIDC